MKVSKNGKSRRCFNCINFKTLIITRENINRMNFIGKIKLHKRLKDNFEVRIYLCKRNMLQGEFYVETSYTNKISRPKCPFYNILPTPFKICHIK